MRKIVLLALLLASCFNSAEAPLVQGPSVKKQRQKIAFLQKKLESAEKEKMKAQGEVERLASEIAEAQLSLIRKQVDDYERMEVKFPRLFLDEREALYRMIQSGPSPSSFEAQVELDRILRIITELSDDGKSA